MLCCCYQGRNRHPHFEYVGEGGGDGILITRPLACRSYHAVLRMAVSDMGMGDWPFSVLHSGAGHGRHNGSEKK